MRTLICLTPDLKNHIPHSHHCRSGDPSPIFTLTTPTQPYLLPFDHPPSQPYLLPFDPTTNASPLRCTLSHNSHCSPLLQSTYHQPLWMPRSILARVFTLMSNYVSDWNQFSWEREGRGWGSLERVVASLMWSSLHLSRHHLTVKLTVWLTNVWSWS